MSTENALLLVNLGSPASTHVADVKAYLKQFLMDKYVVDLPYPLRFILVNAIIAPFRSKKSAHAYQSIWWDEGSPLVVISKRLTHKLAEQLDRPVALAMRYGQPSIEHSIIKLAEQGAQAIDLLPLYPHHAQSTVTTVIEEAKQVISANKLSIKLNTLPVFFQDKHYIHALTESIKAPWQQGFDHVLFSYHGLPERHLRKADPTGGHQHIIDHQPCCALDSPAAATCYRTQVYRTTELVAEQLGLQKEQYTVAFQSRLGKEKWLTPYTEPTLVALAQQGVKKVLVASPAFVADCIETLEELGIAANQAFIDAGGEQLILAPCLNDSQPWVDTIKRWLSH
jgi:protoporphyrin/coproporphyrin ferrochelatase